MDHRDQIRVHKGSNMHFCTSEPRPLGMLVEVFFAYSETTFTLFGLFASALTDPGRTRCSHLHTTVRGIQTQAQTRTETRAWTGCAVCCLWGASFMVFSVQRFCPTNLVPMFSPG